DMRPPHRPHYNADAISAPVDRPNNYGEAGDTYRSFEDWEGDELIDNLSDALAVCEKSIQGAMVEHFTQADADYGSRVKAGIEQRMQALKEQPKGEEIGRASGKSKFGQGSLDANEATVEAVDKSRKADPY